MNQCCEEYKKKLIEAFKEAKICCVHEDGDDPQPCGYTTKEAIKIIKTIGD